MRRTILITGGSSGIGAALAILYADKDVTIGLIGRNQDRLEQTAADCRLADAEVETAVIDVTDSAALTRWILDFDSRQAIDLVIANAGILELADQHAETESPDTIRRVMETNYFGTISTINPVIERMRKRLSGQVAVISSLSAYRSLPQFPAYAASKAALKIYYECLRGSAAEDKVIVSIVCPGFVKTSMTSDLNKFNEMMMPVEEAARIIKQGLDTRKALISFPKSHVFGLWLLGLLPNKIIDRLIRQLFT